MKNLKDGWTVIVQPYHSSMRINQQLSCADFNLISSLPAAAGVHTPIKEEIDSTGVAGN